MEAAGLGQHRLALLGCWGQRWDATVWRIDDERRPLGADDFRAEVPPELVVGALDIARLSLGNRLSVAAVLVPAFEFSLLEISSLLVSEHLLAGQRAGPLERRNRGVAPDPIEVGLPIRGTRRGEGLGCARFLRRLCNR